MALIAEKFLPFRVSLKYKVIYKIILAIFMWWNSGSEHEFVKFKIYDSLQDLSYINHKKYRSIFSHKNLTKI